MKKIQVEKIKGWKELEKSLRLRPVAVPKECRLVVGDAIITENDFPVIGYYNLKDGFAPLVNVLKKIRYQATERTGGLPTRSRIFGSSPRVTIRKDYCSRCEFTYEDSKADDLLKSWGKKIEKYYDKTEPNTFCVHKTLVDAILPEWRMGESIWTQGIVNWNNQLRFHKDQGNFPHTWSAMLTFREGISGGYLYLPRYNIALACGNGSLTLFNGQEILHGVSPIQKLSIKAYRYSIVYYSLKQMSKCMSTEQELGRIRKVKTERERKRVKS